jgi:Barstar (barnase inhibitor)
MNQALFIFGDEIEPRSGDLHLTVPPHISSKAALLALLAEQLRFPGYFGWNWDAFEECVRDLSWLPPGRVILRHVDIPLAGEPANATTYVDILSGAVHKMSKSKGRELIVLFPSSLREQIEWLLRS